MANPYVNKVQLADGTSLIDISDTTAVASDVLATKYFYTASGQKVQGTNQGGSGDGYVWQDAQGYVHLSDEEGTQTTIDALTVNASGTYTAQTGHAYSPVTVPSGSATTPTTSISVTPSISVNSSGLITASASGSKSVTPTVSAGWVSNGTAGTVSVSGSNTSQLSTQAGATITPTTSEQTAVAAGKYTTGAVKVAAMPSGTAGTPTATKGTVSNHSISVTPSVTNSTGYITGGTKTGTAVTVSASELVSGSQTVTTNDTYDVTNLAEMVVNVASSGGGGLVYETGTWTPSEDVASYVISFSNTHTEAPFCYQIMDVTGTYSGTTNAGVSVEYFNFNQLFGAPYYEAETTVNYGVTRIRNRTSSATATTTTTINLTTPHTSTSSSSTSQSRYWATATGIKAYTNSSTRYWRAGRTYKWIAVWAPTT